MKQYAQPYHRLLVWQRSDEFAKIAYEVSSVFPREEQYGMVSQLRRAALSIALNIVEGQARSSRIEYKRFLEISRGSCSECAYLIEFARDQMYISQEQYERLEEKRREVNYLLQRLIKSLNPSSSSSSF